MTAFPTLLVLLDSSSKAPSALAIARGLAHAAHATVTLLYLDCEPLSHRELLERLGLSPGDARGLIVDQIACPPAEAIVREASTRQAAFVLWALDLPKGASHSFENSMFAEVLRSAPCPVIIVPASAGRQPWTLRHILAPQDGAPTSASVIAPMADLALRAGADLVLLYVVAPDAERPTEPGTLAAPRYLDHPHHEWPLWMREFLERSRCACHPAQVENIRLQVTRGETSAAILELAKREASDLIVLAWRGSLEPARARTIRRVIDRAHCPVVIFRVQP